MQIAVTGSIATDHLATFPGRFVDSLLGERLDKVSLSFLVDDLVIRRGGIAANICYGMGELGQRPLLVGAVGADFADYRVWLEEHGVDTGGVKVSTERHTARFLATTDADQNQISSFYAGAMAEAREIALAPLVERVGALDLVVISPNDPEAMLRHTDECRSMGVPFAADISQQLARMEGPEIRRLVEGARYLFTNDYEKTLVENKTGWSDAEVLSRVGTRVTTLGADGVAVERAGEEPVRVKAAPERQKADPTGVGDAFRAGYLCGLAWELGPERCAQVGGLLATYVLESIGPQEYAIDAADFLSRLEEAYGATVAADVRPHLSAAAPV